MGGEVEAGVGEALDVGVAVEFGAVVGGVGAVLDGSLSRQSSARVVGAVSLPPLLGGLSQVHVQEPPLSLVVPDASVDGLMAELESPLESHSPGDLLGAPVLLLQQSLDQVPVLVRESAISP